MWDPYFQHREDISILAGILFRSAEAEYARVADETAPAIVQRLHSECIATRPSEMLMALAGWYIQRYARLMSLSFDEAISDAWASCRQWLATYDPMRSGVTMHTRRGVFLGLRRAYSLSMMRAARLPVESIEDVTLQNPSWCPVAKTSDDREGKVEDLISRVRPRLNALPRRRRSEAMRLISSLTKGGN